LDILVAKLTPQNVVLWNITVKTPQLDVPSGIALDGAGSVVYVTGYTYGDLQSISNAGQADVFTLKLSAITGNIIWTRLRGSSENDFGKDVTVDTSTGQVYVTGYSYGNLGATKSYIHTYIHTYISYIT